MLRTAKRQLLTTLQRATLTGSISRSRWRGSRLLILAYHGFSLADEHEWNGGLYLTPDLFYERLTAIKRGGYTVLPLDEALTRLWANDLPEKAVVLTIDDGNYDVAHHAYPMIRDFGWAATIYLTTYYVDYNRPVFDGACAYLLWRGRDAGKLDLQPLIARSLTVDLATDTAREQAWRMLYDATVENQFTGAEKDELLARIAVQLGIDYAEICARRILHRMNPEEVKTLAADGADIQLHTHRHRVPRERELFLREVEDNRRYIENLTGKTARHFCYPSGVYYPEVLPWLKEAGVVSATTCDLGMATAKDNPYLLPRFLDGATLSAVEFDSWLAGVGALLPHR